MEMAMRPVDKGTAPSIYARYQEAQSDLLQRLGNYCSYCERWIETHLAVEHVQPKCHVPALATTWSNFLLGCVNCNSCKGDTPVEPPEYLWPDVDNTMRAFEYKRGGVVEPRRDLEAIIAERAQATIRLVGLDRFPGSYGKEPTIADQRWLRRQQAWEIAERCRRRLIEQDTVHVRELIVELAASRGEFSIWWTVFAADADMRRRLRRAFLGTHEGCFDANEDLVPRAGGQL